MLIESIKLEHEKKIHDTPIWIVPATEQTSNKSLGRDVGSQEVQVNLASDVRKIFSYAPLTEEFVPTSPLVFESELGFSKRNANGMHEKMEDKVRRVASKKDLEGNQNTHFNSFDVLSDVELICRASSMGVIIPDNNFTSIDVLRELERVREELEVLKKLATHNQEHGITVTDGLGRNTVLV
ncbi:hypothetical protein D1007_52582 [Hordeum vulgare]|nr:hypothetical protein D1007_52582 [Hordeum vulgare]